MDKRKTTTGPRCCCLGQHDGEAHHPAGGSDGNLSRTRDRLRNLHGLQPARRLRRWELQVRSRVARTELTVASWRSGQSRARLTPSCSTPQGGRLTASTVQRLRGALDCQDLARLDTRAASRSVTTTQSQ